MKTRQSKVDEVDQACRRKMEERMGGSTIGRSRGASQDGIRQKVDTRMHPPIRPEFERTALANESIHESNAKPKPNVAMGASKMSVILAVTSLLSSRSGTSSLAWNVSRSRMHRCLFQTSICFMKASLSNGRSSKKTERGKTLSKHSFLVVLG